MKKILLLLLIIPFWSFGQGKISGNVIEQNIPLEGVHIQLINTDYKAISDPQGKFIFNDLTFGKYQLKASFIGYKTVIKEVIINKKHPSKYLKISLEEENNYLNQIVVTGTRTARRKTESPVIVHVMDKSKLEQIQACSVADGLSFQPGLRMETDCQTCSYSQLRMNGLSGSYSQILINGRNIFSPLTGLYGLEQMPSNMLDRIEVVRGAGSALYGSSAIGGTVNIFTKTPEKNSYEINFLQQFINGETSDMQLSGNASVVNEKKNAGLSAFVNKRKRETWDANDDRFSELPSLNINSFGLNGFFIPKVNQKIEWSYSNLQEKRYGGEMVDKAPHLALQSEDRTHDVDLLSVDYEIEWNEKNASLVSYLAYQNTDRDHYTGIFPDDSVKIKNHLEKPPYGISNSRTFQGGIQFNKRPEKFFKHRNQLTLGLEFQNDQVFDEIRTYNYLIDQNVENFGLFAQSDWDLTEDLNLLTGVRLDHHNFLDQVVLSPRISALYKVFEGAQFRLSWGQGFRAPQAFDTDLHLAFAGGGVSRISLAKGLKEERSNSWSTSFNYDYASEHFITGFTLEGFYTNLKNAFYQHHIGEDAFGELFEKRNGAGAVVRGLSLEYRYNYDEKFQIESGFTFQKSEYDEAVTVLEGLEAKKAFLRTPNTYGFATLSYFPTKKWAVYLNYLYTGTMDLVHFAGAEGVTKDQFLQSDAFSDFGLKFAYKTTWKKLQNNIEFYGGVKNVFNAYQKDFDKGKNRDSNYIYGPSLPRTFYFGLKIGV
ncbi:MAG: TonB-dependent receptor [Flavobacteriales bacterium]|jgi:outer membrane receptor for ferrienterochelin and colicins|nr:TonB-dependent receptor [Flavobacteriales bacterium]